MQNKHITQSVAIATGSFLSGTSVKPRSSSPKRKAKPCTHHMTGAMMSISLLAVPTCLDTTLSATQLCRMWERVFHYGHRVLPAIALATGGIYMSIGLRDKSKRLPMVVAGLATVSIMPFTWIFMFPTNDRLFAMVAAGDADIDFAEARGLVIRWCRLHLTRSFFPLIGSVVGLMAR
jgi:hypothetical protein